MEIKLPPVTVAVRYGMFWSSCGDLSSGPHKTETDALLVVKSMWLEQHAEKLLAESALLKNVAKAAKKYVLEGGYDNHMALLSAIDALADVSVKLEDA